MSSLLQTFLSKTPLQPGFGFLVSKGLISFSVLALGFLANKLGRAVIIKFVGLRTKEEKEPTPRLLAARKRAQTMGTLLQNILKYFIFFVCGYIILEELIGAGKLLPVLAGAGVVGLAFGFGAQSLIKDVVSGFFILFENQYAVGDVVHLVAGPYEAFGAVEEFGLRVTKIKDFNGNLHYVPNGAIVGVDRYIQGYLLFNLDFTLPLPIESRVEEVLNPVGESLEKEHAFLLSAPRVAEVVPVFPEGTLIRVRACIVPFKEEIAEKCAQAMSEALGQALHLEKPPTFTVYQISDEALSKYKESILVE